jgi:outer membrane receptor for ferrienterochelin and colicin
MTAGFRRLALSCGLVLLPALLSAQTGGRIVGKVIEAGSGHPIAGARIMVSGTTLITTSRVDGRYLLTDVPAGTVMIRVAMIGYTPKAISDIRVGAGEVTAQDVILSAQATVLEEVVVNAAAEQGSVNSALETQQQSGAIVNAISAEEMRRSPDGDAATALQRMSGATIQDGKYLNMRGLGDRYTQASLNGARIPSPEPERKVVPLDLFPSALLSEITTTKTFTPDQAGDFSGGAVNIKTREFPGQRYIGVSVSAGFNSAVTGKTAWFAPATSRDWIAFGSSPRALPKSFESVDFTQQLPATQANALINSLRNIWSSRSRGGSPNGGFGLSVAGTLPTRGTGIGYLISGNYAYAQEIRADERRAQAQPPSTAGGGVTELDRYDGSTGRSSVLWGGIANLSANLGTRSKLTLNSTYNRTMDNEGRFETGSSENLALPLQIQRLRYVERNVFSSQLGFYRELNPNHHLDLGLTVSGVARKEPDRSEIVYETSTGTPTWYGFSNEAAVRTFANLAERSLEGAGSWRVRLGGPSRNRFVQVGGLYRHTSRDAVNTAYSIALRRPLSESERALEPEELFDGRLTSGSDATLHIVPLGAGGSYDARDDLAAGYAMVTLELSPSLELIGGGRVEHSRVEVNSRSSAGEPSLATPQYTDVLPSLALNYRAGRTMNLRLSATQTLSRPEYRELSPILFREVIGGDNVKGNPDLRRALIRNLDLRWEWYPRSGEVLSAAVFAKWFADPIERVYQGTSGTRIITYVNAKGAENVGLELEARRSLGWVTKRLDRLTTFANLTLMRSRIRIDPEAGSLTNSERKMVGQAPYVLNAGLTWKHPASVASATILFNRVGERISEAGEIPLPDVVERPRNMLDASITLPLYDGALSLRVDAKNLLDSRYQLTQGQVVREGYRSGRVFSIGFNWRQ